MNVLDLFSGIGGFSLGLESTGFFKTIAFVEKDKFCQKVLRKNFPNIPIEDEVRNVKGERFKADVITGGFPCQPFSVAGKRRGTEDDRFLWDETIRIVSEQKPKWFIGENVEGIINIQDGMVFRQIHDDLESEGFEVQSLVIPASGVGAWHQRKRVWIIANSNNNGSYRQERNKTIKSSNQSKDRLFVGDDKDVSNTESVRGSSDNNNGRSTQSNRESRVQSESGGERSSKGTGEDVPHSGSERGRSGQTDRQDAEDARELTGSQEHREGNTQPGLGGMDDGVSSRLDGHQGFITEPDIPRVAEKIPDRVNRLKALGNSIVPQIIYHIGMAILEEERKNELDR